MSNHSPKPWRRDDKNQWLIRDNDGVVICEVDPWDSSGCRQEDQDNARLIASAPELLEALKNMLALVEYHVAYHVDNESMDVIEARQVIEKVES